MPIVLRISDLQSMNHTLVSLKRIRKRLPLLTSGTMLKWGKILEKDMKMSARRAGIKPFTGTLFKRGIEWRMRPRGRIGQLFVRQYGIALDSMRAHFVNITRRRSRLLAWGLQARRASIRNDAQDVQNRQLNRAPIYVRPHPFLRNGWRIARPKLSLLLREAARRAIT